MANRFIAIPKLLKPLKRSLIRRPLNSAAPSAVSLAGSIPSIGNQTKVLAPDIDFLAPPPSPPIINLTESERLFASIPTSKLLHSATTLRLAAFPPAVDLGVQVMSSRLMSVPVVGDVILAAIRRTVFEHFCAGESADAAAATAGRMASEVGLRGMLVYGVEHAHDDMACDRNLDGFLRTVESAKSLKSSS